MNSANVWRQKTCFQTFAFFNCKEVLTFRFLVWQTDSVVNLPALQDWQRWLKAHDRLWVAQSGSHFHYFDAQSVAQEVIKFWQIQKYLINALMSEIPMLEM